MERKIGSGHSGRTGGAREGEGERVVGVVGGGKHARAGRQEGVASAERGDTQSGVNRREEGEDLHKHSLRFCWQQLASIAFSFASLQRLCVGGKRAASPDTAAECGKLPAQRPSAGVNSQPSRRSEERRAGREGGRGERKDPALVSMGALGKQRGEAEWTRWFSSLLFGFLLNMEQRLEPSGAAALQVELQHLSPHAANFCWTYQNLGD